MRLIYTATQEEVKIGDLVTVNDESFVVAHFYPPHSPASSGRITISDDLDRQREYYAGVIGAEWIEREDRT